MYIFEYNLFVDVLSSKQQPAVARDRKLHETAVVSFPNLSPNHLLESLPLLIEDRPTEPPIEPSCDTSERDGVLLSGGDVSSWRSIITSSDEPIAGR